MNGRGSVDRHSPRKVGLRSVSLAVDEVSPATYSLSDKKSHRADVKKVEKTDFFDFAKYHGDNDGGYDASVDRETSVADIDHL